MASTPGVNVQVLLRCRPANQAEVSNRVPQVIRCNEGAKEVTLYQHVGGKALGRTFHFDKVFGPETTQHRLYAQAIHPIVEEVLEGFNCTIFAYGQTGTGKTFTMEGGERDRGSQPESPNLETNSAGVIPRAINHIFQYLEQTNTDYTVKCSFLELYNEETTDLLAVGGNDNPVQNKLRIMEDRGGVIIHGLEEIVVRSEKDIYTLLDRGSSQRKTAETLLNKQSSRSHSVFVITVHMRELNDGEEVIKTGKLYLVDLAGSENISRSGAVDVRAKEAGLINKSLLTLGRVITALVENSGHVPYRDSKLTRLLRDSLGGKTKTCIIATIAPTVHCAEETLSTLDYAHRAKNIRNRPEVNRKVSKTAHIKELNSEIERLKAELHATREKNGVYIPSDTYYIKEAEHKTLKDRVHELESELQHIHYNNQLELQDLRSEAADAQQQLSVMHVQLEEAHEALRLARQGIEERDFLIATHERSEEALADHAVSVSGELQHAATDITALFVTVAAAEKQHRINSKAIRSLRDAVDRRADVLVANATQMVQAQQKGVEVAVDQLQALERGHTEQLSVVKEQLNKLKRVLGKVLEAGKEDVWALQERLAKGTSDVRDLHSSYVAEVQAATSAATAALQEAETQLETCIQQQQQHIASYAQQHAEAMRRAAAGTTALVDAAVDGLRRVGAAGAACLANITTELQQQAQQIVELETTLTETLASQQEQLLARVGELLREHTATQTQVVGASLATVREGIKTQVEELNTAAKGVDEAVVAATGVVQETVQEAQVGVGAAEELASAHCQRMHEGLAECRGAGAALRGAANAERAACTKLLDVHATALEASLEGTAAAIDAAAEEAVARFSQGGEQVTALQKNVGSNLDASTAHTTECVSAAREALVTNGSALQGYEKEHMGETQALKTEVATQAEEKYQHEAATGNAPTMRTITVPPRSWVDDMRTPVPEVVLAEFHRQKALLTAAGALLQVEGRLEGKVDGAKENTSSNAAPDTAAAPDSETQTTTESHGPTSRIPKLLRGLTGNRGGSPKTKEVPAAHVAEPARLGQAP